MQDLDFDDTVAEFEASVTKGLRSMPAGYYNDDIVALDGVHPTLFPYAIGNYFSYYVNSYYSQELNIIIMSSAKAASTSLIAFKDYLNQKIDSNFYEIDQAPPMLEKIYESSPRIIFLYRDPFCRTLSYYYYMGRHLNISYGLEFSWDNTDMDLGLDMHRIPQCTNIPFYIGQDIKQDILTHKATPDCPAHIYEWNDMYRYSNLIYKHLLDVKMYENMEFFWINESHDATLGRDVYMDLCDRFDVPYMRDNETNLNPGGETFKNRIPSPDIVSRILESQSIERQFIKSLKFENQDPVFWGIDRSV